MSKIFKIKKYWISSLCLLFFSLTTVAQEYSDNTIGFDINKATSTLNKFGVEQQDIAREITIMRKMYTRAYQARQKSIEIILQKNVTPQTAKKSAIAIASDISQTEKDALKEFYDIAIDKNKLIGWNFSTTVTSWNENTKTGWKGVTVENGHITALNLYSEFNLNGIIPTKISQLSELIYLGIWGNSNLRGSIPAEIGLLHNLQVFSIYGNGLNGTIPTSIGQLSQLSYLEINEALTGSIPTEISQLTNLTYIAIQSTQLSGTIPPQIFQLPNVTEFYITGNVNLNGPLPSTLYFPSAEIVGLNYNNLTGSISSIGGPNLAEIYLSVNQLNGPIPLQIGNVRNLSLNHNKLTGTVPLFSNIANLTEVYLNNNQLSGPILIQVANGFTSNLSRLEIQSNKFTFSNLMNLMEQHIVPVLVYSPQSKVGQARTIDTEVDRTVVLSMQYDDFTPTDTFQWYRGISPNGVIIQEPGINSTSSSLRLSDVGYSDSGYYYCIAKNPLLSGGGAGQQLILESESIKLNVLCYPQTKGTLNINSEDFLIGKPVNFSFETTATNLYYKWTFYNLDGTISGSSTISPTTAYQTYNLPGTYKIKLEVTQSSCITTFEKTFTVNLCKPVTGIIKVVKPITYSFSFSGTGKSTSASACGETAYPQKFYAKTAALSVNTQLYLNEALTAPIVNGNLWYKYQNNATAYKIDNTGKITEISSCSPSVYSFQFSDPGRTSASLACSQTSFTNTFYAATSNLGIGTQLYLNSTLTTPVGSGNLWYQYGIDGISYRIDNSGKVAEATTCGTQTPPTTAFYYRGQWPAGDTIHDPEVNCWVTYLDENNVQHKYIVGPIENGCQAIQAVSIVTENNVHICTP
jgi:uncharacterized protein YjbI with pentapeptide repeats